MLSSGNGNPYLRPEYLNPPPTMMDSKKSPLALLAQTCNQIGADPLAGSGSTSKSGESKSKSKSTPTLEQRNDKSSPHSLASNGIHDCGSGSLKSSQHKKSEKSGETTPIPRATPPREATTASSNSGRSKSISPKNGVESATMHSGSSIQHPLMAASDPLAAYKSLIPAMHPAYLQAGSPFAAYPPFAFPNPLDPLGAYANALNAVKSAMPPQSAGSAALGFPGAPAFAGLPYGRMKSPAGVDPCRDPYCTGCPSSLAAGSPMSTMTMVCPVGCAGAQCEHPRIPIPVPSAVSSSSSTSSTVSSASIPAGNPSANRPYVCNWIVGDNYCGKRFPSSEDLLQHLRTHTNLSTSDASAGTTGASAPPTFPHPLRTYPTPPLSPLSAARYHPYGKGSSLGTPNLTGYPASLLGVPLPPSNPAASYPSFFHHPGLAPYYSHLSMFGPRVGTAPLPP